MLDPFDPQQPSASPSDLSQVIAQTVERLPGDIVRCARITEDRYRCNWWCRVNDKSDDNPAMKGGQIGTSHRIRKSCFLRATRKSEKLVITNLSL